MLYKPAVQHPPLSPDTTLHARYGFATMTTINPIIPCTYALKQRDVGLAPAPSQLTLYRWRLCSRHRTDTNNSCAFAANH